MTDGSGLTTGSMIVMSRPSGQIVRMAGYFSTLSRTGADPMAKVLSDIEIAQQTKLEPIVDIAKK